MSDTIETIINDLTSLFELTDEVLSEWQGEGNLQIPVLLGMMAVKMNWDEKQVRENDALIRYYIRRNPDWHVTRGAHGGIMRTSDKQKKEDAKLAKETAKKQMQEAIAAKVAASTIPAAITDDSEDSSDSE
jgi:hypothetical protein